MLCLYWMSWERRVKHWTTVFIIFWKFACWFSDWSTGRTALQSSIISKMWWAVKKCYNLYKRFIFCQWHQHVVENCNCTRPENINHNYQPRGCSWDSSLQDIMLLCALIVVALTSVFFLCLYIRGRKMRMSRSGCPPESCPFMNPCYSGLAGM